MLTYAAPTRGALGTDLLIRRRDARGDYLTVLEWFDSPESLDFGGRRWRRTEECEARGELTRRKYRPESE